MKESVFLCDGMVALPGAGRRTLLALLPPELQLPATQQLCVLDAGRLEDPVQIELLQSLEKQGKGIFILNKAELAENPQALIEQTVNLLRQQGIEAPELYPICAEAARLFRRAEAGLSPEEAAAFAAFYARFGPDANGLSCLARTGEARVCCGGLELTHEQLRLALVNTGVPLLEARLRELACRSGAHPVPEACEASRQEAPQTPAQAQAPGDAAEAASETDPAQTPAVPASLRELAERGDCGQLLETAKAVSAGELAADCREQALTLLHTAYLERTHRELESLVSEAEARPLSELLELRERINNGPYPLQIRTPYAERITSCIEGLQKERLRELCAGIEGAELRELEEIRERLSAEPCAEVLKNEFFARLSERKTALDRMALDRVVEGAEHKSLKELQAVSVTLQANNWNQKLVTAYRHKVELLKEAAIFRELQEKLANLNDLERRELISLKEKVAGMDLAPRFTVSALDQIDLRLYRMDMLRLIAMNNDFDRLNYEGLDLLRAQVMHTDVCAPARKAYLKRLMERENAIVLETAEARGHLARQLAEKHKLRTADFVFAAPSREYEEKLAAFWGGSGKEQARDYPAFLLTNGSSFAMTGTRFYYKTDRGLEYLELEEIQQFQYMKQKLSLNLQIVRKDNTYLLSEAKIGRGGAEYTLSFFNECLQRWNEPGVEKTRSAIPLMTARFELSQFTQPVEPVLPSPETARATLREQLSGKKLAEGLIPEGEEGRQKAGRILQAFELPEHTELVWYSVSSLLGSIREGAAIGPKAIYCRQSKQPTQIIPLETICQIQSTGSKQLTVTNLGNQRLVLNVSGELADCLRDYVAAIQLGAFLREAEGGQP